MVEAKRLRWLADQDRRASFRKDGYISSAVWLAHRFHVAAGSAKKQVQVAQALEQMPHVRDSLFTGGVSSSAVQILADARREHPAEFAAGEKAQVDAAISKPVEELRRVVSEWAQTIDEQLADRAEILRDRRRLNVCPTPTRMVRVEGELDPEGGEAVLTALQAMVDAELRAGGGNDLRTPVQRRADALCKLAHRYLQCSERPTVGGERPHVTVTVECRPCATATTAAGTLLGQAGASWTMSGRSPRPRPAAWPATPRCCRWCWAVPPSPWTWDDEPRWSRRPYAGRSCSGTSGAGSLPAPGLIPGATPTTRPTGPTVGRRLLPTWCCCAGPTTAWCTRAVRPEVGRRQTRFPTTRGLGDRGRAGTALTRGDPRASQRQRLKAPPPEDAGPPPRRSPSQPAPVAPWRDP